MRIHSNPGSHGEESGAGIPFKIHIFHPAHRDAPGLGAQTGAGGRNRGERQTEIVSQSICRAHGNDAQCDATANQTLQDVVHRTIASAGKDRVTTCGDGTMRLPGCIRLAARRLDGGLNARLPQDRQCPLHQRQPSRTSPARQRVVQENSLAHGK